MRPTRHYPSPPTGAPAHRARSTATTRQRAHGFTLVEILIVVLILAILAAIIVPQFTSAAGETRDNAIKMDLFRIRQQLAIYKQQHNGDWPSVENFEAQMTLSSNIKGETAPLGTAGYVYGPYLNDIPPNAYTSTNDVTDGEVGSSAWYYNEETGEFRANDTEEHRTW